MASTQNSKAKIQRGKSYTDDEDVMLCKAWINVSQDPVVGKDQTKTQFWKRIAERYESQLTSPVAEKRSDQSLSSRWHGGLSKDCSLFNGKYKEVLRMNHSGANEAWEMQTARDLFKAQTGYKFKYEACWQTLRDCPKFDHDTTAVFDMTRPQTAEQFPDTQGLSQFETPHTPMSESINEGSPVIDLEGPCKRPPGRNASKEGVLEKGKRRSSSQKRSDKIMGQFLSQQADLDRHYQEEQEKNRIVKIEHFEINQKRMREEDEAQVMMMVLTHFEPLQQEWIRDRRREIMDRRRLERGTSSSNSEI